MVRMSRMWRGMVSSSSWMVSPCSFMARSFRGEIISRMVCLWEGNLACLWETISWSEIVRLRMDS